MIGSVLCDQLVHASHEVVGVDLVASYHTTHLGDVADKAFVASLWKQRIDCVVLAIKPPLVGTRNAAFVQCNVVGCRNVVEEARRQGVLSVVYVSSIACADHEVAHSNASECDPQPTEYKSPYDRTK